jgi:flagellar motor switch protein FliN/FliY
MSDEMETSAPPASADQPPADPAGELQTDARTDASPEAAIPAAGASQAAPLLMGVKLPIRVLLGRTQLSLRDIAHLGNGSVVELDCSPDDPVEITVNDRVIAYGEVVVVAGNYGVRITKIASEHREAETETRSPVSELLKLSQTLS